MKVLRCRDAGFDCDHVIQAETENDVLWDVVDHAREVHEVEVTVEMAEQVKSLIREEQSHSPAQSPTQ